jgi:hypothetical protein
MANIFLSIPILDKPEYRMIHSVYQAILSCREHRVRIFVNENDSLISRVRNVHMSLFYHEYKDCDYFMSLDSDLEVVNCFNTNNIFTKLLSHDKDFVGGLYALKKMQGPPVCASVVANNLYARDKIPFNSGLIEMLWLSTGCWCLKRSAVEKMINSYPDLTYMGDDNVSGKVIHGLYNPMLVDIDDNGTKIKKYLSEDWSFAQRWKALGGQIYADTSIVLKHIGKQAYSLWNVEVVSKPAEAPNQPPLQMPQINFTKAPNSPSLPPAGFNLKS